MKIGYDAKRVFHNWRGLGNYGRNLVCGLHDVAPENDYVLFTPPIIDQRGIDWKKENNQFEVISPKGFFSKSFPSMWRRYLGKEISGVNCDLFHGLSHEVPYGIDTKKTKSIVTIHDLIFLRYPEFFPWIDRKVYLAKIKHACRFSDKVIAICQQTKDDLIYYLKVKPEKIEIAYQSCDPIFYERLSSSTIDECLRKYDITKKYFLYVGALDPRKNLINLIEAYGHFGTSCDLVIVGNGLKHKELLLEKIKLLNLEDHIKILSDVPSSDLPALYQGALTFCFPSFFEGFGIPIIEAMMSRVPVITSLGSCFPEVAGPGALYINPNSSYEIAKAMDKLYSDQSLYDDLVRMGTEHVNKFHQNRTNQVMINLYRGLF